MESTAAAIEPNVVELPAAVLRGTARGLEAVIDGNAPLDAITGAIEKRIDEAPTFFRGSDIRIRVEDGPLAMGSLTRLEELALKYQLRIVEITAAKKPGSKDVDAIPQPSLAKGSAPTDFDVEGPTQAAAKPLTFPAPPPAAAPTMLADSEVTELDALVDSLPSFEEATQTAIPLQLAATAEIELETVAPGARLVIGPVRSGVILEHTGHVIIFGDVNPGAEVRAEGNIIVLGRLRGTAHAGIGQDVGFILALQLQPQQLRISRQVARAADSDSTAPLTEIAYVSGGQIVVERYTGKLPASLATSI
jgi:septum site-determining protein MinC